MGWFGRSKKTETPEEMLARFRAEQPGVANAAGVTPVVGSSVSSGQMTVEDVFQITGRGTVATGVISSGVVRVGSAVRIERADGDVQQTSITGIEKFRKRLSEASMGENCGLLFAGKVSISRGDVLYFS